jgi:hypothetical protein
MKNPNTRIDYMYRDSGNNKYRGEFVVRGRLKLSEMLPYLHREFGGFGDIQVFVPRAIGPPHLLTDSWDPSLDHEFHEIEELSFVSD